MLRPSELRRVGDRIIAQVTKDLDRTETALHEWVQRAGSDAGTKSTEVTVVTVVIGAKSLTVS